MEVPDLAISYLDKIPNDLFDDFSTSVNQQGLKLLIEPREDEGPFAGIEWMLPTTVLLFIAKSYFDSFLKEMGKDHYHLLKQAINGLRSKVFKKIEPKVKIVSSSGKVSDGGKFSIVFSIIADAEGGKRIKFLFQNGASEEEHIKIVDGILSFLKSFYDNSLSLEIIEDLKRPNLSRNMILLQFNVNTNRIEVVDPRPETKKEV